MAYNVTDLIDKAIKVSIRRKKIYEGIGRERCDLPSLDIMVNVLSREIDKTIEYYEELKNEIR